MDNRFEKVMDVYINRYEGILEKYWPTMKNNGFTEHNQTVNFVNAYENVATKDGESVSHGTSFRFLMG